VTIAKPYPSDPSMRETRVADAAALPVTDPVAAPGGAPAPNSPRAREEGLGVKPAVVKENLEALAELAAADPVQEAIDDKRSELEAEAERQKREARNARRREQRAAKKAAEAKKAAKK
jgi:hypothetical protein